MRALLDKADHHLNRLKEMVLQGDCGLAWEYPLIATAVALPGLNEASALIGPPHRIRLYGQWGYIFTFLGFQWLYFVSSHECTELRHIRLQTNGSLPTTCQPWLPIRKYLADWRVAQQGTSESQSLVEEKPASATITQPAMP